MVKQWQTPTRGKFSLEQMCNEVEKFIKEDPNSKYELAIGTDAQRHKDLTRFVTAFFIYRVNTGAQYFYTIEYQPYIKSLRQKIMYEASLTYKYKVILKDLLKDVLAKHNLVIQPHCDIGKDGKTKIFIPEIKAMFKGFGKQEEVIIKPYSVAASTLANKHSK